MTIVALDQGTTSTRALRFDRASRVEASSSQPVPYVALTMPGERQPWPIIVAC